MLLLAGTAGEVLDASHPLLPPRAVGFREEEEAAQVFLLSIFVCLSRCSHPVLWTFFYAPLIFGGLVRCHGVA